MNTYRTHAAWGDMDHNAHMRNTAYLDKAADARLAFFAQHGFAMPEFVRRGFGPVMFRDVIAYRREVRLHERLAVTTECAGLSADGARFHLRNHVLREDGEPAASIDSHGGWIDLALRCLVAPPPALLAAMRRLPRTADYADIETGDALRAAG